MKLNEPFEGGSLASMENITLLKEEDEVLEVIDRYTRAKYGFWTRVRTNPFAIACIGLLFAGIFATAVMWNAGVRNSILYYLM